MQPVQNLVVKVYNELRKLAKSSKYLTIYSQHKEIGVCLFKNTCNYTDIQITFLQYLSFYTTLNMDIYMNEVSDIVLDNEIYEDAYSYYKSKARKQKNKERDKQMKLPQKHNARKNDNPTVNRTHVVFSKPRIKR